MAATTELRNILKTAATARKRDAKVFIWIKGREAAIVDIATATFVEFDPNADSDSYGLVRIDYLTGGSSYFLPEFVIGITVIG